MTRSIETRNGLPEELRFLLADYPREIWRRHENMGQLTRFWLARHTNFRRAAELLNARNREFLEGEISPLEFSRTMVPGFNALLGGLLEHHTIEDHHYFPKFMAAEPKLLRGFEILDEDHHALHETIETMAGAANQFMQSEQKDDQLRSGERFVEANETLLAFLMRHLDDEEDLIVPLLLDRGEQQIG